MRNLLNKLTIRDLANTARIAGIASLVALAGVGGYWFATKLSLAEAQVLIAVLMALLTVMVIVGVWVIPQLVRTGTGLFREGTEHALAAGAAIAAVKRARSTGGMPAINVTPVRSTPMALSAPSKPTFTIMGES